MKKFLMLFTLCMVLTGCSNHFTSTPFTPDTSLSGSISDRSDQLSTPSPTKEISLSGSIPDGCVASYDPPLDQWTSGDVTVTLTCEPGIVLCNPGEPCPPPPFYGYVSGDCITEPDITVNGITMMACNLGAQRVATSLTDELSYGYLYQRGNNYGFPNIDRLNGTYTPNPATAVNTSAYGPSNPYSSSTFIKLAKRSSSFTANINDEANNLRGGKSDTTSTNGPGTDIDRLGPCPAGYHVPSVLERINALGGQNPYSYFSTYKLPVAGFRIFSTYLDGQGYFGSYWSSSPYANAGYAYVMNFVGSSFGFWENNRGDTSSIRCFKNTMGTCASYTAGNGTFTAGTPTDPDTAWQTTNSENPCYVACSTGYSWNGKKCNPLPPPFYGFVSGDCLTEPDITVNGYTMMACNIGAQNVATSLTDQLSFGYLYQRGNNYGFPNKDRLNGNYTPNSATAINTSAFGPSSPYASDTFIKVNPRSSSFTASISDEANNLRGGKSDTTSTNGPGTGVDRRGPCPTGYHVPSTLERKNALGGQNPYSYFSIYKLPMTGNRNLSTTALTNQGSRGYYWSSSPNSNAGSALSLQFNSAAIYPQGNASRASAYSVRCFKNF